MRRRLVIERPVETDRRGGKRRAAKGPAQAGLSPKERAQDLVDKGMPYQMAMAVVHGRMELNDALERLSRRDRVNQLIERHDLSRALATQVAIGHADLDLILRRRRMKAHREEHRERSCLVPGATLAVARFGQPVQTLTVREVEPYDVCFEDEQGERRTVHKLDLKYAYDPSAWKLVRRVVKRDKRLAAQGLRPAKRPQDRFTCSDRRMFGYVDAGREVALTLVDGDAFKGVVTWFSRYEFGLRIKDEVEVVLFRHALHDIGTT